MLAIGVPLDELLAEPGVQPVPGFTLAVLRGIPPFPEGWTR
jgi:hypothetical protein